MRPDKEINKKMPHDLSGLISNSELILDEIKGEDTILKNDTKNWGMVYADASDRIGSEELEFFSETLKYFPTTGIPISTDDVLLEFDNENLDKSNTFISNTGKLEERSWQNIENISSRIIEIAEGIVILDCLIDFEERIYETRSFSDDLFQDFGELWIGRPFLIRILKCPPKMMFELVDGEGIVNPQDFIPEDFDARINRLKDLENQLTKG